MAIAPLSDQEFLVNPWPRPDLRLVEPLQQCTDPAVGLSQNLTAVVSAGGRPRTSPGVRRRRVALILLVLAVALLILPLSFSAGHPAPRLGGLPVDAATLLGATPHAGQGTFYVVQPGDSLGSIARRLDPQNPGPMATKLAAILGSATVVPGEHLNLN